MRESVPRPLRDELDAPAFVAQALWSDPADSDADAALGVHGSPRGGEAVQFGRDVTEEFCRREGIKVVIRSHQFVPHGYKVYRRGHLVTVFSARNYGGVHSNDSAVILIAEDDDGNLRLRPKRLLSNRPAF